MAPVGERWGMHCSISAAFCVSTLALASLAAAQPVTPSPLRPYYDFVHWMAMGRADLAAEQFAVDAVVVGVPGCERVAPCVGRDAIRARYLASIAEGRTLLPLVEQRFDGARLRAAEPPTGAGVSGSARAVAEFTFGADRIVRLTIDRGEGTVASAASAVR